MLWNRSKPVPSASTASRLMGVALDATHVGAVTAAGGSAKPIALTETSNELPLFVRLDTKPPSVGHAALSAIRRSPHLVCSNYLSQLGLPKEWQGPRLTLTPESALAATFDTLRHALKSLGHTFALTMPEYLNPAQTKAVLDLATAAKLTLTGSATTALAIAAHRADAVLTPQKVPADGKPDWVVPLHPKAGGPGSVLIVDVDEAALSAAAIEVSTHDVRSLASAHWPRASWKLWKDKLLDCSADRCVRLCRRDPRDSAAAEQGLYDQLDAALDASRRGHSVTLSARADRWYQDIKLAPADLEAFAAPLTTLALAEIRELVGSLPLPPKAVWLSARASLLPGLAVALHEQSPEGTEVAVLPPEAAAEAAAALDARFRAGTLPARHHDAVIMNVEKKMNHRDHRESKTISS